MQVKIKELALVVLIDATKVAEVAEEEESAEANVEVQEMVTVVVATEEILLVQEQVPIEEENKLLFES